MNDQRDKRMPVLSPVDSTGVTGGVDASGEYPALPARVSPERPKLSYRYEMLQERRSPDDSQRDRYAVRVVGVQERTGQEGSMYADFDLETLAPAQAARFFVSRLHAIAAKLARPVNDIGEAVNFAEDRAELYELADAIEARLLHLAKVSDELDVIALQLSNVLGLAKSFLAKPADEERFRPFSNAIDEVRNKVIAAMKKVLEAPKKA